MAAHVITLILVLVRSVPIYYIVAKFLLVYAIKELTPLVTSYCPYIYVNWESNSYLSTCLKNEERKSCWWEHRVIGTGQAGMVAAVPMFGKPSHKKNGCQIFFPRVGIRTVPTIVATLYSSKNNIHNLLLRSIIALQPFRCSNLIGSYMCPFSLKNTLSKSCQWNSLSMRLMKIDY